MLAGSHQVLVVSFHLDTLLHLHIQLVANVFQFDLQSSFPYVRLDQQFFILLELELGMQPSLPDRLKVLHHLYHFWEDRKPSHQLCSCRRFGVTRRRPHLAQCSQHSPPWWSSGDTEPAAPQQWVGIPPSLPSRFFNIQTFGPLLSSKFLQLWSQPAQSKSSHSKLLLPKAERSWKVNITWPRWIQEVWTVQAEC